MRGGIELLSLPFVAGVCLSAVTGPSHVLSAVSLYVFAAVLLFALRLQNGRRVLFASSFLFLGFFAHNSRSLLGIPPPGPLFDTSPLLDYIDSLPFPSGDTPGMLKALLVGDRSGLSGDVVSDFRASGASHILALSGLHLGIICTFLSKSLSILGNTFPARRVRCLLVIAASAFYAVYTGAGPSIVRAALFISFYEAASLHPERRASPVSVYCTSLLVQLSISPLVIGTAGFQLSYLAMLGIYLLFPILRGWYPEGGFPDPVRRIWVSMALSLSCQAFTAPLVWKRFRSFPQAFLLTNLLALPIVEAFVVCAIPALIFRSGFLLTATDFLCGILLRTLHIIAQMCF